MTEFFIAVKCVAIGYAEYKFTLKWHRNNVKNGMTEETGERRNDTILLVDDHTDSRTALAHLFREEGMTVLEAESGEEAIGIFEAHNGEIDLLISDMKMPGMDGLELMDRLGQRNSSLNHGRQMKSIALTGYPKEYTDSDTAVYSFDEYMEKSGDFDAILRIIRELLNS